MEKGFGEILREMRLKAGIGLRELARLIDKSPGYLSDVENGRVAPPSEEVIVSIAQALNGDKDLLLGAARKVDPEISYYVLEERGAADFLRMAKRYQYTKEDWERLRQIANLAKLGRRGED